VRGARGEKGMKEEGERKRRGGRVEKRGGKSGGKEKTDEGRDDRGKREGRK